MGSFLICRVDGHSNKMEFQIVFSDKGWVKEAVDTPTFLGHLTFYHVYHRNREMYFPLQFLPLLLELYSLQHISKGRGIWLWLCVSWLSNSQELRLPTFVACNLFPLLPPALLVWFFIFQVNWEGLPENQEEYWPSINFTLVPLFVSIYPLCLGQGGCHPLCWPASSSLVCCSDGEESCHGELAEDSAVAWGSWRVHCNMSF